MAHSKIAAPHPLPIPLPSPLAHVLGSLAVERLEAGSLWRRGAAGGGVARSPQRSPAAPPPLQAVPLAPALEADPPAFPASRRWRLAVVISVLVAKGHLWKRGRFGMSGSGYTNATC